MSWNLFKYFSENDILQRPNDMKFDPKDDKIQQWNLHFEC